MSKTMRCLAVRQPWAWALVSGAKDIENRTWSTDYRGPVILQASASKTDVNFAVKAKGLPPLEFAYGALIGVADLVDVAPLNESMETNPWAQGTHCWRFANARVFREPIPCKGKLNLYTLAPDLADRASAAVESAIAYEADDVARRWLEALGSGYDTVEERLQRLFDSYVGLSDGVNAVRLAEQLLAKGRTAEALTSRGYAHFICENTDAALSDLNAAIAMDATNARSYAVRSLVYGLLAENDKSHAAELDPSFAEGEPVGEDDDR